VDAQEVSHAVVTLGLAQPPCELQPRSQSVLDTVRSRAAGQGTSGLSFEQFAHIIEEARAPNTATRAPPVSLHYAALISPCARALLSHTPSSRLAPTGHVGTPCAAASRRSHVNSGAMRPLLTLVCVFESVPPQALAEAGFDARRKWKSVGKAVRLGIRTRLAPVAQG
jgi:hypothetical protein